MLNTSKVLFYSTYNDKTADIKHISTFLKIWYYSTTANNFKEKGESHEGTKQQHSREKKKRQMEVL